MAIYDVEKHEEKKLRFLKTLYDLVKEEMASDPNASDPTLIGSSEGDIGECAGFTRQEANRISSDLLHDGKIEYMAGGLNGPNCCLTTEGLHHVERHLYEQSALGKRRKLAAKVKEKAGDLAWSGAAKLIASIGGILVTTLAAYHWRSVLRWIAKAVGIR